MQIRYANGCVKVDWVLSHSREAWVSSRLGGGFCAGPKQAEMLADVWDKCAAIKGVEASASAPTIEEEQSENDDTREGTEIQESEPD